MSEYTAEDFAKATFARHGGGGRAARFAGDKWPWRASTADAIPWLSDEEMARDGWVPVVEAEDPEAIVALIGRQATRIRELEGERETSPLTLDALREAWEAAEDADECRKGDVLIVPGSWGGYTIWAAERGCQLRAARILSRAPQREPWQDLADDLADRSALMDEDAIEAAAKALHVAGWRKGGDEV